MGGRILEATTTSTDIREILSNRNTSRSALRMVLATGEALTDLGEQEEGSVGRMARGVFGGYPR